MYQRTTIFISSLCLVLVVLATPLLAQEAPADTLAVLSCEELTELFYVEIPRNVYDDLPDQVFEWVMRLDFECELGEPMGRTQILASIWDGNFQEIIYGYQVISWLVDRYDPDKQPEPGSSRALFDDFTTDFANQMLPHAEDGSLEQFYCLYYSGQIEAAWTLLQSEALDDTWLAYYYSEEVHNLHRASEPYVLGAHYGGWWPRGDLEFVGPKQLAGVSLSQKMGWGFWRFVFEWRMGRSDEPYFVNEDGFTGRSNRWDAALLAAEAGFVVLKSGLHQADVFMGLGLDILKPFKDEDLALAGFNLSFGASYRLSLRRSGRWFLHVGGRYEVIGDRNTGGTNLGGGALSLRAGMGWALGKSPQPRLKALGQLP